MFQEQEPPLLECDVPDVYADDVARVEIFGPRVRMLYFAYQFMDGLLIRKPVIGIVRPIASIVPAALLFWEPITLRQSAPRPRLLM